MAFTGMPCLLRLFLNGSVPSTSRAQCGKARSLITVKMLPLACVASLCLFEHIPSYAMGNDTINRLHRIKAEYTEITPHTFP